MAVVHRIESFEVPVLTESVTYLIVMFYKVMILSTTKLDKAFYVNFLEAMKEDFKNIEGKDARYRYICNTISTSNYKIQSITF